MAALVSSGENILFLSVLQVSQQETQFSKLYPIKGFNRSKPLPAITLGKNPSQ